MKKLIQKLYTGTSGLVLPVPNKSFYPEAFKDKSRLTYYSSLFNSIEINSSFYKIPQYKTILNWAQSVPDHFKFTFKLWQGITHHPQLLFNPADVNRFMESIAGAGNKKGCLLVQFPAKIISSALNQVMDILQCINNLPISEGWKIQLEFRHFSWYQPEVIQRLRELHAGIVLHDMANSATPSDLLTGDIVYLRFHGPEKGYKGNYSDEVLSEYARRIRLWEKENKEIYVYFNNTLGAAVGNLVTLNNLTSPDKG